MATAFCPNGLQAYKTVTSASYSGQTQTFMMGNFGAAGGYVPTAQTVYCGDPVGLVNGGLTNTVGGVPFTPCGVFVSCSYKSAPNTSTGYNTSSAGNPMYQGGTQSADGLPVMGQIISDPHVVYTIQVANVAGGVAAPLTPANLLALANCSGGTGVVSLGVGNNATGFSGAFLNFAQISVPGVNFVALPNSVAPVRILGLSQNPGLNTSLTDPFPFVDVMLLGHLFHAAYPAANPQLTDCVEPSVGVQASLESEKDTKGRK